MRNLLILALAFAPLGCKDKVVVQDDLTGVELTLRYDPKIGIDQFQISGTLDSGSAAFSPGRLPEMPRPLTEGENSLVILLPDEMAGQRITIQADGMAAGAVRLSTSITVMPVLKQLVQATGTLAEVGQCGDGAIGDDEACDDANAMSGDGCSASCAIERGYGCTGSPSVCNTTCGDGIVAGVERCDDANGVNGDGCSSACAPEPGYACTGEPSTCTCEVDEDNDGVIDCDDTCIDVDDDGYGEPGGAGDTCTGRDCDDTSGLCTTNCDDADADAIPDCRDTCIDADDDGYGEPGGGGNSCIDVDCDDAAATCTTDCETDEDNDAIADCADTCIDADGDTYGVAGGAGNDCAGLDCDEGVSTCNVDCTTDADADTVVDCADDCIDGDRDGYGTNGGAGTCLGPDCDDTAATCNSDCSADTDMDGIADCTDPCIDFDRDNYGIGPGCTAPDCNDMAMTCTNNCGPDLDNDAVADCADTCIDRDGDGYGTAGGAGNSCTGADCDDLRVACNVNCTACLPDFLDLTSNSPRPVCTDATLRVDLDRYDGAANDLSCTAPAINVLPLEGFDAGFGRWSTINGNVTLGSFPGGYPTPSCTGGGAFVNLNNNGPHYFQLATPINATSLTNVSIAFRSAYRNGPGSGENLMVHACCGAGCTPNTLVGTAPNAASGGSNECTDRGFTLPALANNCASLQIRFTFPDSGGRAAVDAIEVIGEVGFQPFTEQPNGIYTSPLRVCEPTTVQVTCTWDDGTNTPRSDNDTVVFQ